MNGFYKRDFEKKAEGHSFFKLNHELMKFSSQNSIFYSLLYNDIVEEIMGIKIPDRAQALRMVLCEVARIESHLQFLYELTCLMGLNFESQQVKL